MYRILAIALALAITFTVRLSSQILHDDFFPLAQDNRWTYSFNGFYHDDLADVDEIDSGVVTYSIISKLVASDSTVWQFRESRELTRHYKYWNYVDTTYPMIDTTLFYIVEYLGGNHKLSGSPSVASSCVFDLAFQSNYLDSVLVFRYNPQQTRDSLLVSHAQYNATSDYDTTFASLQRSLGPTLLIHSYWFPGARGRYQLALTAAVLASVQKHVTFESSPDFVLGNNYPNPFNPVTVIPFSTIKRTRVTVRVYDILGRYIITLFDGVIQPGHYFALWNAAQQSSGTYICMLQAEGRSKTIRMMLLK